jgi:hypothetical protein
MSNHSFRLSQQSGVYHTYSLWSRLSPRLTASRKIEGSIDVQNGNKSENPDDNKEPVSWDSNDWPDSF